MRLLRVKKWSMEKKGNERWPVKLRDLYSIFNQSLLFFIRVIHTPPEREIYESTLSQTISKYDQPRTKFHFLSSFFFKQAYKLTMAIVMLFVAFDNSLEHHDL